jgi:hypothetical protein
MPMRWVGLAAVALWLVSAAISVPAIAPLVLLLPFFGTPMFSFKSGRHRFEWTWQDWLGSLATLVVVYAMWKGVDPQVLLDFIRDIIDAGAKKP